jgi:hypothetical protein
MQITRNNDEQSAQLKTSSEAFEWKIDYQAEHFIDFNRVYLKNEYWRSSSHLFNYRTASIHLLCLDLIRFKQKAQLQAKKECRIDFYEKYLNSNDSNHCKNFQIYRRSSAERKALFAFDTSTAKYDHLRRAITFDHQFDISLH